MPFHAPTAERMFDGEIGGMQGRTPEAAGVGQGRAVERAIVDALAAQRRAALAEVDAHLVGAPRFEPALDEGEIAERLLDSDMSDGVLSFATGSAAAPAVAAVAHQPRLDALVACPPAHDRQVAALDGMSTELLTQAPLRLGGAREHNQAARVSIKTMNGTHTRRWAAFP